MLNPNAPSFYLRSCPPAFDSPVFCPPPPPHPVLGFPSCLSTPILLPSIDVFFDNCYVNKKVLSYPPLPPFSIDSKETYPIDEVLRPPVSTADTEANTERASMEKTTFLVRGPRFFGRRRKVVKVWMAKSSGGSLSSSGFNPPEFRDGGQTTIMIKNIPNRLSREKLIGMLDQHCLKENEKEKEKLSSKPIFSEYDFVYMPMDFRNQCNLGYGFVNFTTHRGALGFYNSYQSYKWEIYESKKVCEVSSARIQGKAGLVEHFKKTCFNCDSDDYLPVQFTPPRNGSTSLPAAVLVGSRRLSDCTESRTGRDWNS
ncbi:protein terminal ear1 homolog [Aristolochia californica]|uniref:protein terminal ear1 homolog n=1 Tax=Aristolochia californica TaxID=171875 RepID=UPI0035D8BC2C